MSKTTSQDKREAARLASRIAVARRLEQAKHAPLAEPKPSPAASGGAEKKPTPSGNVMIADPESKRVKSNPSASVRLSATLICEIWLEVRHLQNKSNCVWGYIPQTNPPGIQRLCVVLNAAHWPTAGALERRDTNAVRWLFSVALLERLALGAKNIAVVTAIRRHLVGLALGPGKLSWESVLWASYPLKDHSLLEPIIGLPIYGATVEPGPHKVCAFELVVP